MIIEFKNHNDDSLINDCPDIGSYIYVRSTKVSDHLVGWNNHYFDTISEQWFEETKFYFTCWKDEQYLSEADLMDIEDCNYRNPDVCVKESYTDITYGESEEIYESVDVFLYERAERKDRSSSITIYGVPRKNLEIYKGALRQWHRTGIFHYRDKRVNTNTLPWEDTRW